jgi:hypothetical protein
MVTIDAFQPFDLATLIRFVEAIQEHERIDVPDLKSGSEIGPGYAHTMVQTASEKNGCIRMARAGTETVGFGCASRNIRRERLRGAHCFGGAVIAKGAEIHCQLKSAVSAREIQSSTVRVEVRTFDHEPIQITGKRRQDSCGFLVEYWR